MPKPEAEEQIAPAVEQEEEEEDEEEEGEEEDEEEDEAAHDAGGGSDTVAPSTPPCPPAAVVADRAAAAAVAGPSAAGGGGDGAGGSDDGHGLGPSPAGCEVAVAGGDGAQSLAISHLHHHPQDDEMALDVAVKESDCLAIQKHFRGAWKDDWVVTLIHARGSMDEDFTKSQRPGVDMWARVAMQISAAHVDFDKNSESCRKKWQRVFKTFKDDKAHNSIPGNEKQATCKFYDLVDHYMHYSSSNGHALTMDEPMPSEEVTHTGSPLQGTQLDSARTEGCQLIPYAHVTPLSTVHVAPLDCGQGPSSVPTQAARHHDPSQTTCSHTDDYSAHRPKSRVKRPRRDQKIEKSLSQMVETWKESLEVMKESEAKRIEILQTLSATMVGLLDVLRK